MLNIILVVLHSYILCNNNSESNNDIIIGLPFNEILDTFATTIYFGSNRQKQFKRINLAKQYTWFIKESFNESQSTSYKFIQNKEINFGFTRVIAEESTETVEIDFKNVTLKEFPFYLINNSNYFEIRYGSIGLAYTFTNYHFSLIHQLHKHNHISRLAFGFYPHFLSNGLFYLGGLPKKKIKDSYSASCRVKNNDLNWSCSLSQIYITIDDSNIINNITTNDHLFPYNNTNYSYFQSANSKIFSPRKFMKHLTETIFKPFLDKKSCNFEIEKGFGLLFCRDNLKFDKYNINFVIDNYVYSLNFQELFTCNYRDCEFNVMSSKWNKNTWVFGTAFLKHFYSDFDYEKKMITFYSHSQKFLYVDPGQTSYCKIALIVNCVILSIFGFIIIGIKMKIKA